MQKEKTKAPTSVTEEPKGAADKGIKQARKKHWVFRLIVLILIVIIGSGIYRNLQMKKAEQTKVHANALFVAKKIPEKVMAPVLPEGTGAIQALEEKNETTADQTQEEKIIADIKADEKVNAALDKKIEQTGDLKIKPDSFNASDAMTFRDHFMSEEPCGEDFRKLILSEKKSKIIHTVIKTTSSFCLTTDNIYADLKLSFRKAKKEALISLYREDTSSWRAHLKVALAHVIKIRNLNPTEETVEDTLDRAHNALEAKNIALTVEMLKKLPQKLQPFFKDFLTRTQDYVEAKTALDELVLSYTKGGE